MGKRVYTDIEEMMFGESVIAQKLKARERREPRIKEFFDNEDLEFILRCVNGEYDEETSDVNVVANLLHDRFIRKGFTEAGPGSNRIAFLKDGYIFKIAMDRRGCIDNYSEYLRSIEEPEVLAKTYETNRLIAVAEYANTMSEDDFNEHKDEVRQILAHLSRRYVLQDMGLTSKNYCNLARRNGTNQIIFIDYAYMYKIHGSEDALRCKICGAFIEPNSDFTAYRCSNSRCAMPYLTYEILNHMHRDVDECDDESVVKLVGSDGQGTDTSNFTFVKLIGADVGQMEVITEEEATKLSEKIQEREASEKEFLQEASLGAMTPEELKDKLGPEPLDEDEKTDVPEFQMRNESLSTLSFDELKTLENALSARKEGKK